MKISREGLVLLLVATLGISTLFLLGCEISAADSVVRNVGVDFSGVYDGVDSQSLVSQNSGAKVKSLNLIQTGDLLELVDNNGLIFRGTLGSVQNDGGIATASFTFTGSTTAGNEVTATGTLTGEGESATMKGTWIEPFLSGVINGDATINPVQTNSPTTGYTLTVSISPTAGGSVSKSPDQSSYSSGTVVQLTARASSGYTFDSWSGDASGSANPISVSMTASKSITANFSTTSSGFGDIIITTP